MASELITKIKETAHKISEEYLLLNTSMNDTLLGMYSAGEIENEEILKRICEQANQNVYLALFNNPDTENHNITFDIADFSNILNNSKEGKGAMNDYNTPPKDFRSAIEIVVAGPMDKEASDNDSLDLRTAVEYRQVLRNVRGSMESIKTAELKVAERSFDEMLVNTRDMISNGESIGDISKIASRYVKEEMEGDFMKVAECYDIFHKELINNGFKVKTGFTKTSSLSINSNSKMLEPVKEFAFSMAKISGAQDMINGLDRAISRFDSVIN